MTELKKNVIGKMTINGHVDITDPCYKRDTWCRMNQVEVKAGEYTCVVWEEPRGFRSAYSRVAIIGIYYDDHIPDERSMSLIDEIGVDAGLAGFFHNKPDYTDEQWNAFCDRIGKPEENAWLWEDGFFSSSGYGDGSYPVYVYKNDDGEITALEIRFM